jgi:hypothetical protein
MNTAGKLVIRIGLLSVLSVLPLAAQVDNGVTFKAPFPFYAGETKLPAGSYRITRPELTIDELQIENAEGTKSVFVNFIPTQSVEPSGKSDVTFRSYGGTDYLDRVSIEGEEDGVMIDPTKAEVKAEADANVVDRSTASSGQ